MISDSKTNDIDLEGTSLSLFDHASGQNREFDHLEASDSSNKKAVRGTNFKPNEDILLLMAIGKC